MKLKELEKKYFNKYPTFYNSNETRKIDFDINFVYSGRNRGKSFDIVARCLISAWTNEDWHIGYCRRHRGDMTGFNVESYFLDKTEFIYDLTSGECDRITYYRGAMWFSTCDEDGKIKRVKLLGYTFSLFKANDYKSLQFPTVKEFIFEEVFTDNYIIGEPSKIMSLFSTIDRKQHRVKFWLISNTVTPINPYDKELGLNILNQKQGTIEQHLLFLADDYELKILTEYLEDLETEKDTIKKSNRKNVKLASTLSNSWDIKNYYILESAIEYEVLQCGCCFFCIDNYNYKCDLIKDTNNVVYLLITPHTKEIKDIYVRLYTNNLNEYIITYPNATRYYERYKVDRVVSRLIESNRVVFNTLLIGNNFYNSYKMWKM